MWANYIISLCADHGQAQGRKAHKWLSNDSFIFVISYIYYSGLLKREICCLPLSVWSSGEVGYIVLWYLSLYNPGDASEAKFKPPWFVPLCKLDNKYIPTSACFGRPDLIKYNNYITSLCADHGQAQGREANKCLSIDSHITLDSLLPESIVYKNSIIYLSAVPMHINSIPSILYR